jgi:hypothetical protein
MILLNNLHTIDAVASESTVDFYLRLYWYDNRLSTPQFWKQVEDEIEPTGFQERKFSFQR